MNEENQDRIRQLVKNLLADTKEKIFVDMSAIYLSARVDELTDSINRQQDVISTFLAFHLMENAVMKVAQEKADREKDGIQAINMSHQEILDIARKAHDEIGKASLELIKNMGGKEFNQLMNDKRKLTEKLEK